MQNAEKHIMQLMQSIPSILKDFGANENNLRWFGDSVDPELLPYASLLTARAKDNIRLAPLCGVYEWQSTPLVFLIDGDELKDAEHLQSIRRCMALRGDAPYLGVVRPGQLIIHRIALDAAKPNASELGLPGDLPQNAAFAYLANTRPELKIRSKWVSQVVLKLLRDTIKALKKHQIADYDAISLAGRALFLRFLGDRELLPEHMKPVEHLFDDAGCAERASRWLDDTFNGDFLPIPQGLFARLPRDALCRLGDVLHRAAGGQLYLQWQEDWAYLDFAHIPVGVLSEAYEHYMREHDQDKQKKEGSYYTPRAIADLLVCGAFHALRRDGKASDAVVLDPAAGAGVFLIACFRRLVMERWREDGKRPDTAVLRNILYHQVVGFDVNEAALRFAALGLYLMSIELDPEPQPVEKLRFEKNLRNRVLHDLSDGPTRSLGSLGNKAGAEHVGRYDLVIGNPPWISATQLPGWHEVKEIVAAISRERLPQDASVTPLPNESLDLPFVWRAMQWAKPGGQIAFALHARLLFQQSGGMVAARSALFRALDVSGVVNGAELRKSKVWPGTDVPFCLLFARNRSPLPDSAFRFVCPRLEDDLNKAGILRIDAANAELLASSQVAERPEIFKVLFRGSVLDLEVFDRMAARGFVTLDQYWRECFGEVRGRLRQAGNGYQCLKQSTRQAQKADYLLNLPELPPAADGLLPLLIDTTMFSFFNYPSLHRSRSPEIYHAPLLIVHQSPPATLGRIRVGVADSDLVYNESYYGYSAHGHSDGSRLVRYLALLIGSKPAFWHTLMTSGKFGFEREVIEKIIIDKIPVIPFESLDSDSLEQIDPLFNALVKQDCQENWDKVDVWAAGLYGLREHDLQVIDDTLRYNLPFSDNKKAAQIPPAQDEITIFCNALQKELAPWAAREQRSIQVAQAPLAACSPWTVVKVSSTATDDATQRPVDDWPEVLRIADDWAATEVIVPDASVGVLWIARLNQARYWSRSQGRLVARRIVWEHLNALFGSEAE